MKKLILSLTVAAFALTSATMLAGDAPACPAAKAASDKKTCCADQAKACPTTQKACCADQAKACPTAKKACAADQAKAGQGQAKKACCPSAGKAKAVKKAVSPKGAELAKN